MSEPLDAGQAERYRNGSYTQPALHHLLQCRRVLMLQGPMGSFFNRVAALLQGRDIEVRKINFNAGDWLFHRHLNATDYRGTLADFPAFLNEFIGAHGIEAILCFGDCRHYHKVAAQLAAALQLPFFVFEEGYIRPDYLTLERGGVNMHSLLPRNTGFYRSLPDIEVPSPQPAHPSFKRAIWTSMVYYGVGRLLRWRYPHYKHHRIFSVRYETRNWARSFVRKHLNRRRDAPVFDTLLREQDDQYFVVALQVYNDSQISDHSAYADVRDFITELVHSFASHADAGHHLVFKHHPMDRGQRDYRRLLNRLSEQYGVTGRVHYLHDVHLPTLLRHSRGVVMINSTVGLSALYHDRQVMVMGRALYDLPGLTFQGGLAQFWSAQKRIDQVLWRRFRAFIITQTQVNAAIYGRDFFGVTPAPRADGGGALAAPLMALPLSRSAGCLARSGSGEDCPAGPEQADGTQPVALVANGRGARRRC